MDPEAKAKNPKAKAKKNRDFTLHSLWGLGRAPVIKPEVFTASGASPLTFVTFAFCPPHLKLASTNNMGCCLSHFAPVACYPFLGSWAGSWAVTLIVCLCS